MVRGLSDLANLINEEFTKEGDREVLAGLRKQIISNNAEDNETALKTLRGRGIDITNEEFQTVREYSVFEAQKSAKMMKTTGLTYMAIGILIALMSLYLRNRLTIFGIIAAAVFFMVGFASLKKGRELY